MDISSLVPFEYLGVFWIKSEKNNAVDGMLKLEINDVFNNIYLILSKPFIHNGPIFDERIDNKEISGYCYIDGKKVYCKLLMCYGNLHSKKWKIQNVLFSKKQIRTLSYRSIRLCFSPMYRWSDDLVCEKIENNSYIFKFPDNNGTIKLKHNDYNYLFNRPSIANSPYSAYFNTGGQYEYKLTINNDLIIESSDKNNYSKLLDQALRIRNFLIMITGKNMRINNAWLSSAKTSIYSPQTNEVALVGHQDLMNTNDFDDQIVNVGFKQISSVFNYILKSWLSLDENIYKIVLNYIAVKSNIYEYVDTKFLLLIHSIEALDSIIASEECQRLVDSNKWKKIKSQLNKFFSSLPDNEKTANHSLNKLIEKLNSNLEYMNEPSLGQRLKNILVREEKMRSILFEDDTSAKNFINQCVSKRNKLSHPNKNINNGFPDGKYTIVNNKLDFIFAYCLLKYIGLPEDILCKYHGGSPNYFWARRYKIWEKIK